MDKQKMTLHRALEPKKLNAKKITKKIQNFLGIGNQVPDGLVNRTHEYNKFCENAKADYQSIEDLIKYQARLKSAIVKANTETSCEIAEQTMTIIDAINMKNEILASKKLLLDVLKGQYKKVVEDTNRYNDSIETQAFALAEKVAGREDDKKTDSKKFSVIKKDYTENHQAKLVDPLMIEDKIKELENEIDEFESNVGAVLSEVNAVTVIEV